MIGVTFALFFFFLLIGVPIAFAMGSASIIALVTTSHIPVALVIQRLYVGIDSFSLMAIPFFMLAGELMETGGISKRLVNFSYAMVGHFTAGFGQVSILTSMIFAGVSGSAAADTAAVGSILIPAMKKNGYPSGMACLIQACAGSLGPIIPPSMTMIIYGSLTGTSIGAMFLSGIIPGVLIGLSLMVVTYFYGKKHGLKGVKKATKREMFNAGKNAFFALFMPVIIIGGIISGVFTPTEAGAIAAVYAFIIGFFVYKEYKITDIHGVVLRAAGNTAMALLIIAGASVMGWIVSYSKLPQAILSQLVGMTDSPQIILLLIIGFLMIVGMFIETISATIIVAPILFPIAAQYGIDPIHFALIMVITLVYAGVTPPVGGILYITMAIGDVKMKHLFKYIPAYVGVMVVILVVLSFLPQVTTFIPYLVMGH